MTVAVKRFMYTDPQGGALCLIDWHDGQGALYIEGVTDPYVSITPYAARVIAAMLTAWATEQDDDGASVQRG